jgi:hypothetical protein
MVSGGARFRAMAGRVPADGHSRRRPQSFCGLKLLGIQSLAKPTIAGGFELFVRRSRGASVCCEAQPPFDRRPVARWV